METYTVKTYQLHKISYKQYCQMSKLRRTDGLLWPAVQHIKKSTKPPFNRFIIAETEKGKILGWALLRKIKSGSDVMLYVKREYRRNGIGTELFKHAEKLYRYHRKSKNLGKLVAYYEPDQGNFMSSVGYKHSV